jgi:hypothetical protein
LAKCEKYLELGFGKTILSEKIFKNSEKIHAEQSIFTNGGIVAVRKLLRTQTRAVITNLPISKIL